MSHRRRRPSPTTTRPRCRRLAVASIFIVHVVLAGWNAGISSSFRIPPRDAPAAAARRSSSLAGNATPHRRRRPPSSLSFGMSSTSSSTPSGVNDDVESSSDDSKTTLSPETIAELIEVSFVQSCLQLSRGYVDVLKLFVVSVKAGYEKSISLRDLDRYVVDCPIKSAGRELVIEEVGLRSEWMGVVYGLLDALGEDGIVVDGGGGDDDDDDDAGLDADARGRIAMAIRATLSARAELRNEETRSGGKIDSSVALSNLTVERALSSLENVVTEVNEDDDPVARAFLTNDVRVALVTLRVLEEEEVCTRDAAGRKSSVDGGLDVSVSGGEGGGEERLPRPSIPGT